MSSSRERHIHTARVCLDQARHFGQRGSSFAFRLLEWAGAARRRAMDATRPDIPVQPDLFG